MSKMAGMTDEEFIDMMVMERIQMILRRKPDQEQQEVLDAGEQVIWELDEEKRKKVEAYLDILFCQGAEDEEKLYRAGIRDGIWIVKKCLFPER